MGTTVQEEATSALPPMEQQAEAKAEAQRKAAEMLEEMIQSTHQLDEILQRMCAATVPTEAPVDTPNASDATEGPNQEDEGGDDFQDCIGSATGDDVDLTAEGYFQTIRRVFQASGSGKIEISASPVDTGRLLGSLDGGGDLAVRFASCTRDTSFAFQSLACSGGVGDVGGDGVTTVLPEFNVSYSYFLSRLRQQIVACDHIVPVERVDAAAQLAFMLLEEQQRWLLGAISNHFPYQRESMYWTQGNRVCEVVVQETQKKSQWGLLVQLNVTSQLRARVNKHTASSAPEGPSESASSRDPGLSSCTRCMVFLPKKHYLGSPSAEFQASIAVELVLHDPEEQEDGARASTNHSATHSNQRGEVGPEATLSTSELSELVTVSQWGAHDDDPALGIKASTHTRRKHKGENWFKEVKIETPFPRNRIIQAACGRFHTLFLNDMGLVFAYGHTLDGALGLGYEVSGYVAQPTLVDFFFDNLIVVQDIACGGDQLVGAHSAAVSQDGGLFSWGVGIALGRGSLRSAFTPQRIDLPPVEITRDGNTVTMPSTATAHSVSCGSGFCVALTRDGHAFSWGKWGEGRLGLGRIPIIARTSRRRTGGAVRKQFQSFQLTPRQIHSVYSSKVGIARSRASEDALFTKVVCGDAHCVGLTRGGSLVTWGRGNNGQQGRGDASDTLSPTAVLQGNSNKQWRDVAAGENFSMALSSDGQVWTWGACGGAVLGHGLYGSQQNALLAETILQRHQRLLSQRKKSSMAASSCPALPSMKWMTPHVIPCFATDIRICRISAGTQHAAAISDTGDLYMWGEGYSCTDKDDSKTTHVDLSSLPKLVNSGQQVKQFGLVEQGTADIGTHNVEHVVCGGRQTIAFSSGSFLARSMTKLYRESIGHANHGDLDQVTAITGADLVLVVSGQRILVHKLLLAQRSPVLRELILDEEQQQQNRLDGAEGDVGSHTESRMELLLPRLRVDVARALVEFIYTDNFSMEVNKTSFYLVNDVLRAAKLYKLPGLIRLCQERLLSASPSSLFGASSPHGLYDVEEGDDGLSDTDSAGDMHGEAIDSSNTTSRTLNDDMRFALSDVIWADTVLVAEGRQIPVHRCMLIARSEYFRAVLAFQRSANFVNDSSRADKAVVNVEDSYAGIVRVLRFIYYDQVTLPAYKEEIAARPTTNDTTSSEDEVENNAEEEASDQLLEDLVAADKYRLERMKRLCEHAIYVTTANSLEVLAVAELVHAAHLKQVAMRFVQTNLAAVTARREEFQRFQEDFPQLLEELYASLREASRDDFLLREWHKDVATGLAAQREEEELEWGKKSAVSFPWIPLSLAVAFGAMYLSLMHSQEHEFSAVPATNLVAIVAIGGAITMGYL